MSIGSLSADYKPETKRKMQGERVGPHQMVAVTRTETAYGYGSMPYPVRVTTYECACKDGFKASESSRTSFGAHYSATAREQWLEHVLMDVAQKVYDYRAPQCNCMMKIG